MIEVKKMKDRKLFASLLLLFATLLWGLSYSIQTMASGHLGTFSIVFVKGMGGVLLYPVLKLMKKKITVQAIRKGILIGVAAFLGCALQQKGLELSTVSKASFITALYIVIVPLIEVFSGKRMKIRMIVAVGIALLGLYFLCFSGNMSLQPGDLILLAGSFFFALQIIFIDSASRESDPLVLTFVSQAVIAVLSLSAALFIERPTLTDFGNAILPSLYLLLFPGLTATTIQIVYQKDVGASLASLLMSFESVFGALGGWFILGQTLTGREIFGCLLVFIAILLAE